GIPALSNPSFTEAAAYGLSYGGLIFDLAVVPVLLWRLTRPFAFAAAVAFHLTNSQLFHIDIFPWLAIGATTIFFAPDWPIRFANRMKLPLKVPKETTSTGRPLGRSAVVC